VRGTLVSVRTRLLKVGQWRVAVLLLFRLAGSVRNGCERSQFIRWFLPESLVISTSAKRGESHE